MSEDRLISATAVAAMAAGAAVAAMDAKRWAENTEDWAALSASTATSTMSKNDPLGFDALVRRALQEETT